MKNQCVSVMVPTVVVRVVVVVSKIRTENKIEQNRAR